MDDAFPRPSVTKDKALGSSRDFVLLIGRALDLHQGRFVLCRHVGLQRLLAAPEIEVRDVMYAAHRAVRGAGLFGEVFATDIIARIVVERFGRIASLLRAIMHQPLLADIHVARARAALPIVGLAQRDGVLEITEPGEAAILHGLHLVIHATLAIAQRTKLAVAIVDDSHGGLEPEFHRTPAYHQRVFGIVNPAADNRVDVYAEQSVLR